VTGHRQSEHARTRFLLVRDGQSQLDASIRRCGAPPHYRDLPKSVTGLVDGPVRVAGWRIAPVSAATPRTRTPFSENSSGRIFCAGRVKRKLVERDFARGLEKALQLAKSMEANYLPGWCGPSPENKRCEISVL